MWFELFLLVYAVLLSIPLLVIGLELLLSLGSQIKVSTGSINSQFQGSFKILMPAHNEAKIIGKTIAGLLQQTILPEAIIVVADNCTDATAEIANSFGVNVLERSNNEQRGKGFALDYGINYLQQRDPPDILIILDADCEINADSLNSLAYRSLNENRPMQALYLMRPSSKESLKQRVAGFAWLVKNKIRPMAIEKIGLPVTLTGTGMAFPWQVIADIEIANGNIVEDMQLGIDCTLNGFAPKYCDQAIVYSSFPEQDEAINTQRKRWEHGHLMTIFQQVPKLFSLAILRKDWKLLGLALDVGVPPLSFQVMLVVFSLFILGVMALISTSSLAFLVLFFCFLFFVVMLLLAWRKFAQEYLTLNELCTIPLYALSKLTLYLAFIVNRQSDWVRTNRDE